jgi:CRISPR-associated protein Cas2
MTAHDKRWRLVCYDIRDPKRWQKVYKVMKAHGRPVQYSIFRCCLDHRELERMRWELAKVLDAVDSSLIVDLCPHCAANVKSKNHLDDRDLPDVLHQIVLALPDGSVVQETAKPKRRSKK